MNKKLISALMSAAIMLGSAAALADTGKLTGATSEAGIVFSNVDSECIILNGYDNSDGSLKYSETFAVKDGTFTVPNLDLEYDLKAYNVKTGEFLDVMVATSDLAVPTATPAPEATGTPEPAETSEPTSEPYNPNVFPPVYEKAVNALYAFSVIDEVTQEVQDSEVGYRINYYYQGMLRSDWVGDDVEITAAAEASAGLYHAPISSLKRGDVVFLDRGALGSAIKQICVIYQVQQNDIITSSADFGTDFEKLISTYNSDKNVQAVAGYSGWTVQKYGTKLASTGTYYVFGLVANRDGNMLYLLNKSGQPSEAVELRMADDAIVYECDMTLTKGIDVIKTTGISPAAISSKVWNDSKASDTKISFEQDAGYDYALARIVDGKAMDIIVYLNY